MADLKLSEDMVAYKATFFLAADLRPVFMPLDEIEDFYFVFNAMTNTWDSYKKPVETESEFYGFTMVQNSTFLDNCAVVDL